MAKCLGLRAPPGHADGLARESVLRGIHHAVFVVVGAARAAAGGDGGVDGGGLLQGGQRASGRALRA